MNEEEVKYTIAEVGAVYEDGLSLIFPGETEASDKHYKCNTSIYFQAGDRVKICEDSGSYIVEYVIGNPSTEPSPSDIHGIPSGGSSGQVLAKSSGTDYAVNWVNPIAQSVANYYSASTATTSSYNIQFKTNATYNPSKLSWRMGTSGTWHELA